VKGYYAHGLHWLLASAEPSQMGRPIGREAHSRIGEALSHGGSHAGAAAAQPFSACQRRGLARGDREHEEGTLN
jgi:hypothetical protein